MGTSISRYNVLCIGPQGAGKTRFIETLVFGENVTHVPTVGFNEHTIPLDEHTHVNLFELGFGARRAWQQTFAYHFKDRTLHGIILFLENDSQQQLEYLFQAKQMLLEFLTDTTIHVPIVLLFSSPRVHVKRVMHIFGLRSLRKRGHPCRIVSLDYDTQSDLVTQRGLETLEWIVETNRGVRPIVKFSTQRG